MPLIATDASSWIHVTLLTTMSEMFAGAMAFNQPIGESQVGQVQRVDDLESQPMAVDAQLGISPA